MAGIPPAKRKNKEHPEMGQGCFGRGKHNPASVPKTVKEGIKTMSKIKAIDDPFPQEFIEMFVNMALRLMNENEDWIKDYEQETGKSPFAIPEQEAAS